MGPRSRATIASRYAFSRRLKTLYERRWTPSVAVMEFLLYWRHLYRCSDFPAYSLNASHYERGLISLSRVCIRPFPLMDNILAMMFYGGDRGNYQNQWRRQLWGTGARAPLDFKQCHFSPLWSKSDSQLPKYCAVCEIS